MDVIWASDWKARMKKQKNDCAKAYKKIKQETREKRYFEALKLVAEADHETLADILSAVTLRLREIGNATDSKPEGSIRQTKPRIHDKG